MKTILKFGEFILCLIEVFALFALFIAMVIGMTSPSVSSGVKIAISTVGAPLWIVLTKNIWKINDYIFQ